MQGSDLQNILRFIVRSTYDIHLITTCFDFSQEYCKLMYERYLKQFYVFASELCLRKALRPS